MAALGFELPYFKQVEGGRRILIAGAGGGFDVFSGLPLCLLLLESGRKVYLANLSFSNLFRPVSGSVRWLTSLANSAMRASAASRTASSTLNITRHRADSHVHGFGDAAEGRRFRRDRAKCRRSLGTS